MKVGVVLLLLSLFICSCSSQTVYDYITTQLATTSSYTVNKINGLSDLKALLQNTTVNVTFIAYNDSVILNTIGNSSSPDALGTSIIEYNTFLSPIVQFNTGDLLQSYLAPTQLGQNQLVLVSQGGSSVSFNYNNDTIVHTETAVRLENGIIYIVSVGQSLLPPAPLGTVLSSSPQTRLFYFLATKLGNGLLELLNDPKTSALFPTNDAFAANPALYEYLNSAVGIANSVTESVWKTHVFSQVIYNSTIGSNFQATSYSGTPVTFNRYPSLLVASTTTSSSNVSQTNILAQNGAGMTIDTLLLPENFNFSIGILLNALGTTLSFGNLTSQTSINSLLYNTTNNFTLFAPINSAFVNTSIPLINITLNDFISYHYLPNLTVFSSNIITGSPHKLYRTGLYAPGIGGYQFMNVQPVVNSNNQTVVMINNNAQVLQADLTVGNGVMHVLNKFLTPPYKMSHIIYEIEESQNIYDISIDLIGDTNLTSSFLKEGSNFTLLIPTDSAWNNLPTGITNYLALPSNSNNLTQRIIQEHIIPNALLYTISIPVAPTVYPNLNGNPVTIRYNTLNHQVEINNSTKMPGPLVNMLYSNGVAQLIDSVLIPNDIVFVTENVLEGLSFSSFLSAVRAAGFYDYISGNKNVTVLAAPNEAWSKYSNVKGEDLQNIIKLQIIPQVVTSISSPNGSVEYPTLLSGYNIRFVDGQNVVLVSTSGETVKTTQVQQLNFPSVVSNGAVIGINDVFALTSNGGDDDDDGLSAGEIVLIVFACVFGVALLGVGGFFGYRYWNRRGQYKVIQ